MDAQANLSRLEATILYILSKAHERGLKDLSRFELMKLVYLIETNAQKFIGESFAHDVTFVRDMNGPISYDIYKANEHLEGAGLITITKQDNEEYGYPRYCHRLSGDLPDLGFDESEAIFLNSVLDDYLGLKISELKEIVYKTEPMVTVQKMESHTGSLSKGQKLNLSEIPLDEDVLAAIMT